MTFHCHHVKLKTCIKKEEVNFNYNFLNFDLNLIYFFKVYNNYYYIFTNKSLNNNIIIIIAY